MAYQAVNKFRAAGPVVIERGADIIIRLDNAILTGEQAVKRVCNLGTGVTVASRKHPNDLRQDDAIDEAGRFRRTSPIDETPCPLALAGIIADQQTHENIAVEADHR